MRIELQTAVRDYRSNRKWRLGRYFSGSIALLSCLLGKLLPYAPRSLQPFSASSAV